MMNFRKEETGNRDRASGRGGRGASTLHPIFHWKTLLGCFAIFGAGVLFAAEIVIKEKDTLEGQPKPYVGGNDDPHLEKDPPRKVEGLDLRKMGWSYECMECHRHVDTPDYKRDSLHVEHDKIVLDHGNNRFCINCHHPENRNAFVDYDGAEIPESDVVMLCAKCHGPKYRDWKAGVHGRQNGFWDETKGEKTKLRCIQCHDPHSPNFKAMKPLAPLRYPARAPHGKSEEGGHGH